MRNEKTSGREVPELPAIPPRTPLLAPFLLQAEPDPLEIDLKRTALIVVDMQNAFVRKGAMYDLWGRDISRIPQVFDPIKKLTGAARAGGMKVIYLAHHHEPDLRDSGGPNSPLWYKRTLRDVLQHPEVMDKYNFAGKWGAEIIDELKPREGDILVIKPRYSAFFGTHLDMILRTYDIKYLLWTGIAANICVETSIRDAYNLDYFSVLVTDATMNTGPSFMLEATMFNIKMCFGWLSTSENVLKAMSALKR